MITGKILGSKYVINDISADVSGFVPDMSADIYYEVIRLIGGKLLFLPDHLERLQQSLSESGISYPGHSSLIENLGLLLRENEFQEGNIRISLQDSNGNEPVLLCYFIPYFYPDSNMYLTGVNLKIYPHLRPNPGIKKWDDQFRNSVSRYITENEVYEVALKNRQNQITEGSRSNIFFIDRAGSLISTPSEDILQGITRKYVLKLAAEDGKQIIEKAVSIDSMDHFDAIFITGTSPKVLPVKQMDNFIFDVDHPFLRRLMKRFDQLLEKNLARI